jgi:hypothetical protein
MLTSAVLTLIGAGFLDAIDEETIFHERVTAGI